MKDWLKGTIGKVAAVLVLAVVGYLIFWGVGVYRRSEDARLVEWKAEKKVVEDSLRVAIRGKAESDSALASQVPIYIQGRDRILRDPTKPASPEVKACYEAADKVLSACQKARASDSVVISVQASKIRLLENRPSGIPRIQPYGEAMYDIVGAVPVIRAGATAKVFGPIYLSVAGEYAAPPAGQNRPAFRALAGLRVNF